MQRRKDLDAAEIGERPQEAGADDDSTGPAPEVDENALSPAAATMEQLPAP